MKDDVTTLDDELIEEYQFAAAVAAEVAVEAMRAEREKQTEDDAKRSYARYMAGRRDSERATIAILQALEAGTDHPIWYELSTILGRCLTEEEIAALIFALLKAVPHEVAAQAVEAALEGVGDALPEIATLKREEAEQWARVAPQHELRSYTHAAILRMAPGTRKKMLGWLKKKLER